MAARRESCPVGLGSLSGGDGGPLEGAGSADETAGTATETGAGPPAPDAGCAFRPGDGALPGGLGGEAPPEPGGDPPRRSVGLPKAAPRDPPISAKRLSSEASFRAWTSLIKPSSRWNRG